MNTCVYTCQVCILASQPSAVLNLSYYVVAFILEGINVRNIIDHYMHYTLPGINVHFIHFYMCCHK